MGQRNSLLKVKSLQTTPDRIEEDHFILKVLSTSDHNYENKKMQDRPSMEEYLKPSEMSAMCQCNSQCQAPPQQESVIPTVDEYHKLKVLQIPSNSENISAQESSRREELHRHSKSKYEEVPEITRSIDYTHRFLESVNHEKSDSNNQGPSGLNDLQLSGYGENVLPTALATMGVIALLVPVVMVNIVSPTGDLIKHKSNIMNKIILPILLTPANTTSVTNASTTITTTTTASTTITTTTTASTTITTTTTASTSTIRTRTSATPWWILEYYKTYTPRLWLGSPATTTIVKPPRTITPPTAAIAPSTTVLSANTIPKASAEACIEGVSYIRRPILKPQYSDLYENCLTIGHKNNILYVTEDYNGVYENLAIALDKNLKRTIINKRKIISIVAERNSATTYAFDKSAIYKTDFFTNTSVLIGHSYSSHPSKMYCIDKIIYFLDKKKGTICYFEDADKPGHSTKNSVDIFEFFFTETPISAFAVIEHEFYYIFVTEGQLFRTKEDKVIRIAPRDFKIAIDKDNVVMLADQEKKRIYKYDTETGNLVPYASYNGRAFIRTFDFDKYNRIVFRDSDRNVAQWVPASPDQYRTACTVASDETLIVDKIDDYG